MLVVTTPDTKMGRGQKEQTMPVKSTAQQAGIGIAEDINDLPDFDLGILVAFGKIIPQNILGMPKLGILNVHPSMLPKYRGPSPIQTAILKGDEKTGISIMLLDKEIDHGPVLAQKEEAITAGDSHASLIEKLGAEGANLLLETLPKYLDGTVQPVPQEHSLATLTQHIEKKQGFLDFQNLPEASVIDRMIRAFYPWPSVWTNFNGKIVKFLPGNLVQPEGKRPMSTKEFLNGYPQLRSLIGKVFPSSFA